MSTVICVSNCSYGIIVADCAMPLFIICVTLILAFDYDFTLDLPEDKEGNVVFPANGAPSYRFISVASAYVV